MCLPCGWHCVCVCPVCVLFVTRHLACLLSKRWQRCHSNCPSSSHTDSHSHQPPLVYYHRPRSSSAPSVSIATGQNKLLIIGWGAQLAGGFQWDLSYPLPNRSAAHEVRGLSGSRRLRPPVLGTESFLLFYLRIELLPDAQSYLMLSRNSLSHLFGYFLKLWRWRNQWFSRANHIFAWVLMHGVHGVSW